ncbi:hypothetical protein BH23PAT1_BH23PAT1_2210 [soil metagenome]
MNFSYFFRLGNLYSRFILRVLTPPLLALMILSIIGLRQLGIILHNQAIDDLRRSAVATGFALEREFNLRETVLTQTGTELFIIKNEYNTNRKTLENNRNACRAHIQQNFTHASAPNGVCEPFLGGFSANLSSLYALENEYVKLGEKIIQDQNRRINERLSAFKQFFPETLALLIIDDKKQIVSSANSGAFDGTNDILMPYAETGLIDPVRGKLVTGSGYDMAVFAFKIPGGSVSAAYDINSDSFIKSAWESTPIDHTRSIAILLDSEGDPVYPAIKENAGFRENSDGLRQNPFVNITLDNVEQTVVGASTGSSNWLAVVASPSAAVLAPLRDAQLAGMVIVGLLMVGFLWVGTFFIRRTLRNIVKLVNGARVFGAGRLGYEIKLDDYAEGEFVSLADTMNAMAGRIAASEKAMDEKNKEFISIATHEIRSPLTAIIGNLTLFRDVHASKLNDKAKHTIDQAYYSTVRLRDLVNDMLDVAHLESGQAKPVITAVPVKPLINDVITAMAVVAKAANVSVQYDDDMASIVLADKQRLRIIINNFVSNAIKYNRPGGHVSVRHLIKGGHMITVIEDNGLGIPASQKAHMFQKFFRIKDDDRKNIVGTGLGMYIVKQYIEQMDGQIWFESVYHKSTKFSFSLPLAHDKE